mmetsp:Transcript_98263/g.286527  ORF Transcript_98263/g.286527 Transcript_98263/m.286527 type:complete len:318 (+) Transcript_98263:1095-2048(+)
MSLAVAPLAPVRERTILRMRAVTLAVLGLNQLPCAELAMVLVHLVNNAVSLAQLRACGSRPICPWTEGAVNRLLLPPAGLVLALANLQLRTAAGGSGRPLEDVAFGGLCEGDHGPLAQTSGRPTLSAARAVAGPLRPGAKAHIVASGVARRDLLRSRGIARLAAVVGHRGHIAVAVPLVATLGALAPVRPLTPLAVVALVGALLLGTGGCHAQFASARLALILGRRQDMAHADLLTSVAAGRALAPLRPLVQHAWFWAGLSTLHWGSLANARVALRNLLGRRLVALLAVARGIVHHVTLALGDAKALAGASGPSRPF